MTKSSKNFSKNSLRMIQIKTKEEVEKMRRGGKILAEVLSQVVSNIKPGVSEKELDDLAEKLIVEKGGESGFKKVKNYKNTICVSTNSVVVHGIPTDYKIKVGDVVGVDCGVFYEGFNTDMSDTIRVKESNETQKDEVDKFLDTGRNALNEAIKKARAGNRVGDISETIQNIVERKNGYSIVRTLVGHGVGRDLHEEPEIPGFLVGDIDKTPLLREGMTIAVEVIYNMGGPGVKLQKDGWTIKTADGSISGVFEKTVAIDAGAPLILT